MALTDSPTSFYVVGGTLPVGAASYLERDADRVLYQTLKSGELCYMLNARQMGKSSLINRVAQRLKAEGVAVSLLDLTAIGQNLTANQWYYGLLDQLTQQVGCEDEADDFWNENENLGPLRRFFSALSQVVLPALGDKPLVLAVDEIDAVRSITAFNTDEFFAGIRAYYLEQQSTTGTPRVTFCLLGTATPSDLIEDARITPFNIGKRIELRDFTSEEAKPLAEHLPGGASSLSRILFWTGGHPYLTQSICRSLVESPNATVDTLVDHLFLSASARETDDNLKLASNRLLLADADKFALLSLYRSIWKGKRIVDDETNPLCDVLKLSGVVKVEKGVLLVRNGIYRQVFNDKWIDAHLPDADLRRQKQAFRRGLLLAGGIATVLIVIITSLAFTTLQQKGLAERNAAEAQKQTETAERTSYIANMNLIQSKWEENNAGTVLTLLKDTEHFKDRGFEWGYWNRLCHQANLTLEGHKSGITSVCFSPDGKQILTGSWDKTARVWDAKTGKELITLKGHTGSVNSVCFSPDGIRIATASEDKTAKIWDAFTGKELMTLRGHRDMIQSVCYSPDSKRILTSGDDNTAKLWDALTGKELLTIKGHTKGVPISCFSPDGKRIVTGGQDDTIRVWFSE